jgi:hypothetical protein
MTELSKNLPFAHFVYQQPDLCGICGNDTKQVFLDGNFDNQIKLHCT